MLNQLLQTNAGQYDLIIGDAFNDLSIPYHLTTREFDQKLKRLLKDDGFYLALVIDKLRGGKFMPAYTRHGPAGLAGGAGPVRQRAVAEHRRRAPTSWRRATRRCDPDGWPGCTARGRRAAS